MRLRASFTEHPASVGESYGQHMRVAFSFARSLAFAAAACFVHGLLPFLCTRTGSRTVGILHDRMILNRHRQSDSRREPSSETGTASPCPE